MGEIEGWFEGEQERIGAERRRLTSEKKLQSMQSEQKFLGIF